MKDTYLMPLKLNNLEYIDTELTSMRVVIN